MSKTVGGIGVILALIASCGDNLHIDDDADGDPAGRWPITTQSADTATAWFDLEMKLVRETGGFTPPVAARAFGYTGVTLYEAVVNGMTAYQSLGGVLSDMPAMPKPVAGESFYWPAVANAALALITRRLFGNASAENLAAIDALEADLSAGYPDLVPPMIVDRSVAYGRAIADAIFAWSRTDGGDQGYLRNFPTSYVPPVGPGMWVPTPPAYSPAMQPYWGANRPFVLESLTECDQGAAPPPFSMEPRSEFYTQGREVYDVSLHLTAEQVEIAQFWSDDPGQTATPSGHSISLVTQVIRQENATLDVAAEAYAKVGIGVSDAFVACWEEKYHINLLRPVTYIRSTFDPTWMPLLPTPPFPEYASGHSTQSGATARVLTSLFGTMSITDHTNDARKLAPRSFSSFDAAAEEAAISRLYGGIHFRAAIDDGLDMGNCVGAAIDRVPFRK